LLTVNPRTFGRP